MSCCSFVGIYSSFCLTVIELTLKELDGTLANFQFDSQCVMMLHFKQFFKKEGVCHV